ncbi:MAG: sensor histidine kinase [Actinomycetota bacterium]
MHERQPMWRSGLVVAWPIGLGVLLAGTYDWLQGQAPASPLPVPEAVRFGIFALSVVSLVGLATVGATGRGPDRWHLVGLVLAFLAVVAADPTYAALLVAVPLIEIRRRVDEPVRGRLTIGALALTVVLVASEQIRSAADVEEMFVLAIALTVVVLLGDALRRADEVRAVEAELARADERNRLARDLHDSLGHHLLACSIQLRNAAAQHGRDHEATDRSIDLASRAVAEALADTRLSVDNIRAGSNGFSLSQALPELARRASPSAMNVDVELRGDHQALDQLTQITLYRVAQEALSNVVRHANARAATIASTVTADRAVLEVRDDGDGFEVTPGAGSASGLQSLRERLAKVGGRLDVQSEQGSGTVLTAEVGIG